MLAVVGSTDADIKYCSDWMMGTCLFVCPCGLPVMLIGNTAVHG